MQFTLECGCILIIKHYDLNEIEFVSCSTHDYLEKKYNKEPEFDEYQLIKTLLSEVKEVCYVN